MKILWIVGVFFLKIHLNLLHKSLLKNFQSHFFMVASDALEVPIVCSYYFNDFDENGRPQVFILT